MAITNAYQLCVGLFKQSSTGTVYAKLPSPYSSLKWSLTSIIPTTYDFSNIQMNGAQVETVEHNSILDLIKTRGYDSGAVTPPTFTFNTVLPGDASSIFSQLESLTTTDADDPFKVLLAVGIYSATSTGVRTYNVFNACCGILTEDGGRQGEAKANFTGTLSVQACHFPILTTTTCAATLSWTEATGAVVFAAS